MIEPLFRNHLNADTDIIQAKINELVEAMNKLNEPKPVVKKAPAKKSSPKK